MFILLISSLKCNEISVNKGQPSINMKEEKKVLVNIKELE